MIERIVVPLDGSLSAEAILPQVRRVLHRNDSEIILVRAVPQAEAPLGAAGEYLQGQKEKLERAGARVKALVRVGPPVDAILGVVAQENGTMMALATHGASGVSRLLLGSVAEEILRKSPVPVLAVRPFWCYEHLPPDGAEQRPLRNLLLPLDGSDRSESALPGIIEFAGLFDLRVVLLRVLEGNRRRPASAEDHAEAVKQLKALAWTLERKGVEAVTLIEDGDPARRILDAIRLHGIDLIAMTTQGRSGVSRLVAGSVTERVLRSATVPLLVSSSSGRSAAAGTLLAAGTQKKY